MNLPADPPAAPHCPACKNEMARTTLARLAFACAPCREVIQFLHVRDSETLLPWSQIYAVAAE